MVNCAIINCENKSAKGSLISFYSFPKHEAVANRWLQYCRLNTNTKTGKVCSIHFTRNNFDKPMKNNVTNETPTKFRTLKTDAIPTLYIENRSWPPSSIQVMEAGSVAPVECDYYEEEVFTLGPVTFEEQVYTTQPSQSTEKRVNLTPDTTTILNSEYNDLIKTKKKYDDLIARLQQIFTPGQIRCLSGEEKHRVHWSAEDIAAALIFRKVSPEGYNYMKDNIGIPLPGYSTLCKWSSKFIVEQDENDDTDSHNENKNINGKQKQRRGSVKPVTKAAATTTPVRKRGRPRKDTAVPSKVKRGDNDDDEAKTGNTESDSESKTQETASTDSDQKNNTPVGAKSDIKPKPAEQNVSTGGILVSPTGQTLKKIPIQALPPGVKPLPLPVNARPVGSGEVCEMQIGKKMVKVQKIVMTKAEVEAMAKQGLVEMKDGTMVLKQGIKLPTGLKNSPVRVGEESSKESPTKSTPTRCELGDA